MLDNLGDTCHSHPNMAKDVPKTPETERPLLTSFALVKKAGVFYAIAIQSRGTTVLKEKVLESDDARRVILDVLDSRSREYWIHGVDPFIEKVKVTL